MDGTDAHKDSFVDETVGGVTELRIHGVSGTPPASVLGHPHTREVGGDREAGFHRREWLGGPPAPGYGDEAGRLRREAYAWGGLTSGSGLRALWLLLLPFMLVNVGFFMMPRPAGRARAMRRAGDLLQRWFALSLTGTVVLAALGLTVDLVAWQCTAPGGACRTDGGTDPGWLGVFAADWMAPAERRLALASLVPAALVVLLWSLGRWTWAKHERTGFPAAHGAVYGIDLQLGARKMWNGARSVGRLRALHVAAGFAVIALVTAWPMADGGPAAVVIVAALVVLLAAFVLVALHSAAARVDPDAPDVARRGMDVACVAVRWSALAVYLLVLVLAAFDLLGPEQDAAGQTGLPGFAGMIAGLYLAQLVLLALLTLVTCALAWVTRGDDAGPAYPRALHGLGAPIALMSGWLLAGGWAAGGSMQVARLLGTPATAPGSGEAGAVVVPGAYWWVAIGTAILAAGPLLIAVVLGARWWLRRRALGRVLGDRYGDRAVRGRAATHWAAADLTDGAGVVLGALGGCAAALIAVGTYAYIRDYDWPDRLSPLTTLGSWIMGGIVLGLLIVGRDVYRRPSVRRVVGVLWDIGTFWPRAIHPFAPPCYTERVIPDLIRRIGRLTPGPRDTVVLSGHSQGSVIAAALVLQLDEPACGRIRLLTYGCPLARLYGRFFPSYFNTEALGRIGSISWCNLYRLTDPIGGPVIARPPAKQLVADESPALDHQTIDHHLWDPALGPESDGLVRGHVDYFTGPAYPACLSHLERC
jgi:hypothetical protein